MKNTLYVVLGCLVLLCAAFAGSRFIPQSVVSPNEVASVASALPAVSNPFVYNFNVPGVLDEADEIGHSTSPYWWVNSGGKLLIANGIGSTIIGSLPSSDPWYQEYANTNPVDTDDGAHPQNIFRLVTRSEWTNVSETSGFYIVNDNFSQSPNHNASNGLLLFNRYQLGGQTLYYAGIRVDGTAVIKKKIQESPGAEGIYYTMAQKQIFPGTYAGDVENVNLIPHGEWINLKSDVVTNSDGSVTVTLSMQLPGDTTWKQLLQATDTGQYDGTKPITEPGYEGIRTDFMDVEFKNFTLTT